jgi:Kef-type K+ transport system membrane component KefB
MSEEIRLLLDIAILLFSAKVMGEVAERLKIDAMVGEILAGILVGPILGLVNPNAMLAALATIGVVMLLFLMGLSTRFDEVKSYVWNGSIIGIIAALLSLAGGLAAGLLIFDSWIAGAVIGVALMGTSTAVPIKILLRSGQFRTRAGQLLVAIAMADDVVTILGLSLLSTWLALGYVSFGSAVLLGFAMVGFILLVLTVGSRFSDRVLGLVQRMQDEQILMALPVAGMFGLAWLSDSLGIAAVTGAFLAGMAMAKSVFAEPVIVPKVKMLGYGFFVPLFFAYSALIIDLSLLAQWWWVIAVLFAVGAVTKVASSGLMASRLGYKGKEAGIVAIGMIPRGEYGIVIAQLALAVGAIANHVYGSLLAFIILSVVVTPILFRLYLSRSFRGWGG